MPEIGIVITSSAGLGLSGNRCPPQGLGSMEKKRERGPSANAVEPQDRADRGKPAWEFGLEPGGGGPCDRGPESVLAHVCGFLRGRCLETRMESGREGHWARFHRGT